MKLQSHGMFDVLDAQYTEYLLSDIFMLSEGYSLVFKVTTCRATDDR
jgi:hypothetical protein